MNRWSPVTDKTGIGPLGLSGKVFVLCADSRAPASHTLPNVVTPWVLTMLIRDFVYADTSLAEAVHAVTQGAPGWLGPLAVGGAAAGETVRLRIGPTTAVAGLSLVATVRVGESATFGDGVVLPITWEAAHVRGAFPVLQGELEIAPMGPRQVQVTLTGRYEPPSASSGDGSTSSSFIASQRRVCATSCSASHLRSPRSRIGRPRGPRSRSSIPNPQATERPVIRQTTYGEAITPVPVAALAASPE